MHRSDIWSVTQREILFALSAIFGVIVMSKDPSLSRLFLAAFILLYSLWITWMNLVGHRLLQRRLFRSSAKGRGYANTVVVAPPKELEGGTILKMTGDLPGANIIGHVPYGGAAAIDLPGFPFLGSFENIREICRSCNARLLLALGLDDRPGLVGTLQDLCDSLGMRLIWVEDKASKFKGRLDSHQSGSRLMFTNWFEPLEDPINRAVKRAFDIAFAGLVTVTILPGLCVVVWCMHRLYSPGPLFFRQQRTGRNGEIFDMLKFRSMHLNDTPAVQAKAGDQRIFPGGNWLRRSSLDEMPQFLNVLSGENERGRSAPAFRRPRRAVQRDHRRLSGPSICQARHHRTRPGQGVSRRDQRCHERPATRSLRSLLPASLVTAARRLHRFRYCRPGRVSAGNRPITIKAVADAS